jgi:hypothetical protein
MDEVIKGFRFHATMQLRTPLRILSRHGETHTSLYTPPPTIVQEQWEGIWLPITKSLEELVGGRGLSDGTGFLKRFDSTIARPSTVASDIGPVLSHLYLSFLVAVREIVEADDSIKNRMTALRAMEISPEWKVFLRKHGGKSGIADKFFPYFMNLGPRLNTPNRIASASDAALLGIKGVGPAKLASIRERCATITTDRDSERLDCVRP